MKRISFYVNAAASVMFAFALSTSLQSCVNEDNPAEGGGSPVVIVEDGINTAEELISAIETTAGEVTVQLAPNAEIVLTEPLNLTKKVKLIGDVVEPATIVLAEGGIVCSDNFTAQNLILVDSLNSSPMISLASEPTVEFLNETDYYGIEAISLTNVTAIGVKGSIFYDNNVKYAVVNFKIEKSLFELATATVNNEALISFQAGGIKDFSMRNSTVYNTSDTGAKYFLRYNNNGRMDRMGFDKNTDFQSWIYVNNTFYKAIDNENGQWGNGPNGQNYFKYEILSNIWVDSSKDIIRRLTNGRYATNYFNIADNTYWKDGAALNETSYDKSGSELKTDPAFTDVENFIFTPTGVDQVELHTGDPRWFEGTE